MSVTPQARISVPSATNAAERTVYEGGLLADQLGLLKARTADMKKAEESVKADLISMAANVPGSPVAFEGQQFRATVSFGAKRVTDYRAVIDELARRYEITYDVIAAAIAANTEIAEGVPTVKVSARKSTH